MMQRPTNQMLNVVDEKCSDSRWVTRYLQEELEKGLKNPGRASKWFRDKRGWVGEAKGSHKEGTEYLSTRVPQHILRALKKYTADHNLTIRAFITDALEKALKDKGALREFVLN